MSNQEIKGMLFPLLGFFYGSCLSFFGFLSAGFGHGTYLLIDMFSAPLWVIQNVAVELLAIPVIWCFMGFEVARVNQFRWRIAFLAGILVHYIGVLLLLIVPMVLVDWSLFREALQKIPYILIPGLSSYVLGQVGLWIAFFFSLKDLTESCDKNEVGSGPPTDVPEGNVTNQTATSSPSKATSL